jgi:hypothetical protein
VRGGDGGLWSWRQGRSVTSTGVVQSWDGHLPLCTAALPCPWASTTRLGQPLAGKKGFSGGPL